MGSYLDTLGLCAEIAHTLRLSRNHVACFMAGEQGGFLVLLWRTFNLVGFDEEEKERLLGQLKAYPKPDEFQNRLSELKKELSGLAETGRLRKAFRYAQSLPLDLRVAVKPFPRQVSGAKTVPGTAEATAESDLYPPPGP